MILNNPNALNPTRAVYSVIGNLCKNPQLLREQDIIISEKDFPQEFHKIIFSAIYNMAFSNMETTEINEIDIDNYLAAYPKLYQVWEKHDGLTYVRDSIQFANEKTFRVNYDRLRKFSLLRFLTENGIDITDLYNFTSSDLKEQETGMKIIDAMNLQEIMDKYVLKVLNVKDNFNIGQESKNFMAGDDAENLLEELQKQPEFGYPYKNSYYNAIFRGMRLQKFMLRSAGTGTGKTRQSLADMVNVAVDEIYDVDKDCWVPNGIAYPALYISTELEKKEVQSIMLAVISGIDEDVIKDGRYSEKVYLRLKKALQILKKAPIYCVYVDDFSIQDIEMIIEKNIIEHNVKFIAFDYIQMTPKLSRTMKNAFGHELREDQILVQFSAALKILCNKYNVYIVSSTQLNRNAKITELRDTTSLRGGSATADKVDFGLITFKVTGKELDNLNHILERNAFEKPNYSHWVYKNRGGRDNIIIWTKMNLGNMRETALFITDMDYNLINDIKPIDIDFAAENDVPEF